MQILDTPLLMREIRTGARKDDCIQYNACLSLAAYTNHISFSCTGCSKYMPTLIDQPELKSRIFSSMSMEDLGA